MESRMDKIFQAYIDNEISLDEICTKFNITSWDFFKKLANFCNLHFVDFVGGKIKFPFGKIKLP
ncbi:hypothetical protein GKA17_06660 [Campylobacter jejuni]|nr:hypothetical protein [Campylobacter jejuni]